MASIQRFTVGSSYIWEEMVTHKGSADMIHPEQEKLINLQKSVQKVVVLRHATAHRNVLLLLSILVSLCVPEQALTLVCSCCPPQLEAWFASASITTTQPTSLHPPQEITFPTHSPKAGVCACACKLPRTCSPVCFCLLSMNVCVCTWDCQMCFNCVWRRRGRGRGRFWAHTERPMFRITLLGWGKKEKKKKSGRESWSVFSSAAFDLEFMEAAAVENEDLLCGLCFPDSSPAWR